MIEMIKRLSFNSPFFGLKIRQTRKVTVIDMQVHSPIVNTCEIPETLEFLKTNYPGVLKTQCFNDKDLPFSVEVKQTEIGHLFEHILIENLCALKIKGGSKSAVFNGTTSWNWQKNPYGSFQIWIDIGKKNLPLLIDGLKITIGLTKQLIKPSFEALLLDQTSPTTNNLRATV